MSRRQTTPQAAVVDPSRARKTVKVLCRGLGASHTANFKQRLGATSSTTLDVAVSTSSGQRKKGALGLARLVPLHRTPNAKRTSRMDIDSPPSDTFDTPAPAHLLLPGFSASFPLPFRVLTLVGLAIFLWAVNLHVLAVLGVDAGRVLGVPGGLGSAVHDDADDDDTKAAEQGLLSTRTSEEAERDRAIPLSTLHRRSPSAPQSSGFRSSSHAYALLEPGAGATASPAYAPVYMLGALYTAWVGAGWIVWRGVTGGEVEAMERWRGWLVVIALGVGVGVWVPSRGMAVRERRAVIACVSGDVLGSCPGSD